MKSSLLINTYITLAYFASYGTGLQHNLLRTLATTEWQHDIQMSDVTTQNSITSKNFVGDFDAHPTPSGKSSKTKSPDKYKMDIVQPQAPSSKNTQLNAKLGKKHTNSHAIKESGSGSSGHITDGSKKTLVLTSIDRAISQSGSGFNQSEVFLPRVKTDQNGNHLSKKDTEHDVYNDEQEVHCDDEKNLLFQIDWAHVKWVCHHKTTKNMLNSFFEMTNGNRMQHCHGSRKASIISSLFLPSNERPCFPGTYDDKIWDDWEWGNAFLAYTPLHQDYVECYSRKASMATKQGMKNWYNTQPGCIASKAGFKIN